MSYTLFDINGKVVSNGKVENGQAEISLKSFEPSTYIIKIMEKKKEIKTMKIIKE